MVLTLLAKLIAIHVQITIVKVLEPDLKRLFARF